MFMFERNVGRLIEGRITAAFAPDEQARACARMVDLSLGTRDAILCVDFRGTHVFSEQGAQNFVEVMRSSNAHLDRIGYLVSRNPTLSLQLERLIREAKNPKRRMFQTAEELEVWLNEALSEEERKRLHRFLSKQ